MYYNVVSSKTEESEDEKEIKSHIEGLAFIDETTAYPFFSKTKSETEEDENEVEIEEARLFHISTNENSYIEIKEEFEIEGNETEQELKYNIVENNILTLSYSIEIENENSKDEIEVKYNKQKYEVKKSIIGEEIIYTFEYKDSESKVEATFKKSVDEEGNVVFTII